jgi:hypothetical protein
MYFKKAIRLDPRSTSAHEALGDVEEATRLRRT